MPQEPGTRHSHHGFQRARLFEQMACIGNDVQAALAPQLGVGGPVQSQYIDIPAAHDEQRCGGNPTQRVAGEIRASAAADDGPHVPAGRRVDQRSSRPSAGTEEAARQSAGDGALRRPIRGRAEPFGEQRNIEHLRSLRRFALGEKVEQQRSEPGALQRLRGESVARAEPARVAAMREQDNTAGHFGREAE